VAKKSRTASRASRPQSAKPAPSPVAEPIQRVFASKVTVGRATVDVPMLVLRGEWLKAIGFPIGATAFLSTDQRGDITLRRMGVTAPRRLRVVKAKP
jgi:hypothetical protein